MTSVQKLIDSGLNTLEKLLSAEEKDIASVYGFAEITAHDFVQGFSENKEFDEQSFDKHLNDILAKENYKNVSIKIFNDRKKYLERLQQLKTLDADETYTSGILETIKNVIL